MADLADASVRLDPAGIKEHIKVKLGGNRYTVEIDPQQVDLAIATAIRACRKHLVGQVTLSVPDLTENRLLETADGVPAAAFGLTRCDFMAIGADSPSLYDLSPFDLADRVSAAGRRRMRPGEMFERVAHQRASSHVFGVTNDFRFNRGPPASLYLYVPLQPCHVSIDFACPITTYDQIPFEQEDVFLRHIEGTCRIIVGSMRGKFGGVIIGPTGDIQTDAAEQILSGKEMLAAATLELQALAIPMPPLIG